MEIDYDFRKSQVKFIKHTRFSLIGGQIKKTVIIFLIGIGILFIFYQILYARGPSIICFGFICPPPEYYTALMLRYRYENWEILRFYWNYISGNWNDSLKIANGLPVIDFIKVKLPITLELFLYSYLVTIILLPRLAKLVEKRKHLKPIFAIFSVIFVTGIICQYFFGIKLGMLPIIGILKPGRETPARITGFASIDFVIGRDFTSLSDFFYHMILPVSTLTLYGLYCGIYSNKYDITSTDQKVKLNYLARGFTENQIPKNTNPKFFRTFLSQMFCGAILTEVVFNLKGIGMLLIDAMRFRDFPLIIGILFCLFVLDLIMKLGNVIYRSKSYILTNSNLKYL